MIKKRRQTYKYQLKIGNKVVHVGITNDLKRREAEHRQKWPEGHVTQVGKRTTREAALAWERAGGKATHEKISRKTATR